MLRSAMLAILTMVVATAAHGDCVRPLALYDALVIAQVRGGSTTSFSATVVATSLTRLRHRNFTTDTADPPTWLPDDLQFYDAVVTSLLTGAAAPHESELLGSDAIRFHKAAMSVLADRASGFSGIACPP